MSAWPPSTSPEQLCGEVLQLKQQLTQTKEHLASDLIRKRADVPKRPVLYCSMHSSVMHA